MDANISLITAFAAGFLSFVSPCVLPLLSSYLVFISGNKAGMEAVVQRKTLLSFTKEDRHLLVSTLFFVLGFSVVFVILSIVIYGILSVGAGGIGRIINRIAGSIIILLGVNTLFNFLPFLKYDDSGHCATCTPRHSILSARRTSIVHPSRRPRGFGGAFLVGLAFGAGWTPCVGAFLGSILLMASQSGTMTLSALYLAVYSLGLGLPFLLASLFWGACMDMLSRMRNIMPLLRVVSGIFLIAVGVLMLAGRFFVFNIMFQKASVFLGTWALGDTLSVRLIPALLFLLFAVIPLIVKGIRRRRISIASTCWSGLMFILAAANGTGFLNCANILAQWFSFTGI
ncbi:MAG: cytochrome c biogenesis protein CcdA [Spirochaetaceae bacterium]|jgi:cytochrome c-type biogenesis protein|nr:cytochrome c biogenesis protein CcdA [Spirochaetaceae bacterium]